jgi:hypothetical protein
MIAHDVHTYVCAASLNMKAVAVPVTPYSYQDVDLGPYNPSYHWEMREGASPVTVSEHVLNDERAYYAPYVHYEGPVQGTASSLQVLALYSAEPDWGMDEGLKLSPLQAVTAGSQGYRHLRYGWFFLRAGVAHRRVLHFNRLARLAFESGDRYWGLRFSGRTVHYIQDLLTPFHLKPIPEWYWVPRVFRLREVFNTICLQHMRFEGFTGYHLWHGSESYLRCIEESKPFSINSLRKDLLGASRRLRRRFYGLFRECCLFWGDGGPDSAAPLEREWIRKQVPSETLNTYIHGWLSMLSSFVKGYLGVYVLPRMKEHGA